MFKETHTCINQIYILMAPLLNPILQPLPLRLKYEEDTSSIFSYSTCAVAVQYWVLRPQEKNNT